MICVFQTIESIASQFPESQNVINCHYMHVEYYLKGLWYEDLWNHNNIEKKISLHLPFSSPSPPFSPWCRYSFNAYMGLTAHSSEWHNEMWMSPLHRIIVIAI